MLKLKKLNKGLFSIFVVRSLLKATDTISNIVKGANLTGAKLSNTDLSHASLAKAIFYKTDLSCVDFTEVDLTGVDLQHCLLNGVTLPERSLIEVG